MYIVKRENEGKVYKKLFFISKATVGNFMALVERN